jgi:hypothetical protein
MDNGLTCHEGKADVGDSKRVGESDRFRKRGRRLLTKQGLFFSGEEPLNRAVTQSQDARYLDRPLRLEHGSRTQVEARTTAAVWEACGEPPVLLKLLLKGEHAISLQIKTSNCRLAFSS